MINCVKSIFKVNEDYSVQEKPLSILTVQLFVASSKAVRVLCKERKPD